MEIYIKKKFKNNKNISCLVIPFSEKKESFKKEKYKNIIKLTDFCGKIETSIVSYHPKKKIKRTILVGIGKNKLSRKQYIKITSNLVEKIIQINKECFLIFIDSFILKKENLYWKIQILILEIYKQTYMFHKFKKIKEKNIKIKKIIFITKKQKIIKNAIKSIIETKCISECINNVKELSNMPPNICTPSYISLETIKLAKKFNPNIKIKILNKKQIKKKNMNLLINVSKGSKEEPKLVIMKYKNNFNKKKEIAIIGKGITFDSGGLSIKSSKNIIGMKYDMTGAAIAINSINLAAKLNLKINLKIIIPLAENIPGPKSYKPDDIIKSLSGLNVEIKNTDAEGRLILADAISYAQKTKPSILIDIATLTGSCAMALGKIYSGLFSNSNKLANKLIKEGIYINDKCWKLPLDKDYEKDIESNVADIANIGGEEAGSITAALFLNKFIKNCKWIHLDIAGVAFEKLNNGYISTGRPMSLISKFLIKKSR